MGMDTEATREDSFPPLAPVVSSSKPRSNLRFRISSNFSFHTLTEPRTVGQEGSKLVILPLQFVPSTFVLKPTPRVASFGALAASPVNSSSPSENSSVRQISSVFFRGTTSVSPS